MKTSPSPHPLLPAAMQATYRDQGHWADLTLAEVVRGWAVRDPGRPAIVGEHARTYGVIRRGGLQIDVIEMEELLSQHAKITDVVVVGEPDPRIGERAVVVAVPVSGDDTLVLPELVEHLTSRGLVRESLPERLILVESLPRTERGKIRRAEVKRWVAERSASLEAADAGGLR